MSAARLFLYFLIFCSLSGCSGIKEGVRGFCGSSTKVLEDNRSRAIAEDFNLDFNSARSKIKAALKEKGCPVYREDPSLNLIAVFVSERDTTPVGIFLTALNAAVSRVEVSSPSTYGKEFVAKAVFNSLKGIPDAKKD